MESKGKRELLDNIEHVAVDIIANLPYALMLIGNAGNILYSNPSAKRMLKKLKIKDQHKKYSHLFKNLPELKNVIEEGISKSLRNRDLELEFEWGKIDLRIDSSKLYSQSGDQSGTIFYFKDISNLKRVEEGLHQKDRLAGIGSVASGIAHEIKNPLSAVDINLRLLENKFQSLEEPEWFQKYIDIIRSEIYRLDKIVENILKFSTSKTFTVKQFRLSEIIDYIITLVQPECNKLSINLIKDKFDEGLTIKANRDKIQQAVLNVIINAIQAVEKDGKIGFKLYKEDERVILKISNTGPKIEKENLNKIFDLFYSTRNEGTGFGLAITQRIIAEHDGQIEVTSTDKGTTFAIYLPYLGNTS